MGQIFKPALLRNKISLRPFRILREQLLNI
jgi:hypothetical protein